MSFKLLIVDDNCVMRRQIKSFLSARPDIEIIGEAEDGEAAILYWFSVNWTNPLFC
jgi:DNA-binding NarL/FixJ family response regulator